MRPSPRVAAVVPTCRGDPLLLACVEALARQEPQPELVLVEACPGAPLARSLAAWPGEPRLVRPGRRLEHAAAVNRGLEGLDAEWVFLLNDDARPEPGCLSALLAEARRRGPGLYQPRILLDDGSGRLDNAGHGWFPDGYNQARGRLRPDGPDFDRPGTVGAVSGAAFLAHGGLLRELGGYAEELGAFGEDAELSLRAFRRGYALRYVPAARVRHLLGASYGRAGMGKVYRVERNRLYLAVRGLPLLLLASLPLWTTLRWLAQARAAARGWEGWGELPRGAALAALAGSLAGLALVPRALALRREDARRWERGELATLAFVLRERVRSRDLGA